MKTLIKNARIIDGSGAKEFTSDLLIDGDKIADIAPKIMANDCEVIDATGKIVSAGLIDAHSHNDWFSYTPDNFKYFEPFIMQGITGMVCGNCGFSPFAWDKDSPHKDFIGAGLFKLKQNPPCTMSEFEQLTNTYSPLNIATFVGHGTARISVAGKESPTSEQKNRMLELLDESLEQGACGVSIGLMYEPGMYSPFEEFKEVALLCKKHDKVLTAHNRAQSAVSMSYKGLFGRPHNLRALDEMIKLAEETGVKLQNSHLIFVGDRTFKTADECIKLIDDARSRGVDITFDMYSATFGTSVVTVILPSWYQFLKIEERTKFINRIKLKVQINVTKKLLGFGFDDIQIGWLGEDNKHLVGKYISQIAQETGKSHFDTYIDMAVRANFEGSIVMHNFQTEEIIRKLSNHEASMFMTDSWVVPNGLQSGRAYGGLTRFLTNAMKGTQTLEDAIHRMSGKVARRFGLKKRGELKPGNFADITVFDPQRLRDHLDTVEFPEGIEQVFVNGTRILKDGDVVREVLSGAGKVMK